MNSAVLGSTRLSALIITFRSEKRNVTIDSCAIIYVVLTCTIDRKLWYVPFFFLFTFVLLPQNDESENHNRCRWISVCIVFILSGPFIARRADEIAFMFRFKREKEKEKKKGSTVQETSFHDWVFCNSRLNLYLSWVLLGAEQSIFDSAFRLEMESQKGIERIRGKRVEEETGDSSDNVLEEEGG